MEITTPEQEARQAAVYGIAHESDDWNYLNPISELAQRCERMAIAIVNDPSWSRASRIEIDSSSDGIDVVFEKTYRNDETDSKTVHFNYDELLMKEANVIADRLSKAEKERKRIQDAIEKEELKKKQEFEKRAEATERVTYERLKAK